MKLRMQVVVQKGIKLKNDCKFCKDSNYVKQKKICFQKR